MISLTRRDEPPTLRAMHQGKLQEARESICGLARAGLVDLYTKHVTHHVRPRVEKVRTAAAAGDWPVVHGTWRSIRRALLAPGQPFHALSLDASEELLRDQIAQFRLPLEA